MGMKDNINYHIDKDLNLDKLSTLLMYLHMFYSFPHIHNSRMIIQLSHLDSLLHRFQKDLDS